MNLSLKFGQSQVNNNCYIADIGFFKQIIFCQKKITKKKFAHHLQRRTACSVQYGRQGAPKWSPGSQKMADGVWKGVQS